MGASRPKATVRPARRDLLRGVVPFDGNTGKPAPEPPSLEALTRAAFAARQGVGDARAAIEARGINPDAPWPSAPEPDALKAIIDYEAAVEAHAGAAKRLLAWQERHPEVSDDE